MIGAWEVKLPAALGNNYRATDRQTEQFIFNDIWKCVNNAIKLVFILAKSLTIVFLANALRMDTIKWFYQW